MEDYRKSPVFDWDTGDFKANQGAVVTVTGSDAVEQIVLKAQLTARGVYLIYVNLETPEYNHKYGSDVFNILTHGDLKEDTRLSELKRAVVEAIKYDSWILDVYNVSVTKQGHSDLIISFIIDTIYDTNVEVKGVRLNG